MINPHQPLGRVIPQASRKEDIVVETTLHDSRPQTPTLGATVSALPTTSVSSAMSARGINNSSISGGQWTSQAGSSFQNQIDIVSTF